LVAVDFGTGRERDDRSDVDFADVNLERRGRFGEEFFETRIRFRLEAFEVIGVKFRRPEREPGADFERRRRRDGERVRRGAGGFAVRR
jgi:hypothetical protein